MAHNLLTNQVAKYVKLFCIATLMLYFHVEIDLKLCCIYRTPFILYKACTIDLKDGNFPLFMWLI